MKTGPIPCYGQYDRYADNCKKCSVKHYCTEARSAEGRARYLERTSSEVAAFLEQYAAMPEVYETPSGKSGATWQAMIKILVFLTSLHPTTLAVLKHKVQQPDWQREEAAKALGIKAASVKDKICARRPVAVMFHNTKNKGKSMSNPVITADSNVYLAGPMTGYPENNAPAFHEAEERIAELYRCNIVNPAFSTYLMGENRKHEHYIEVSRALVRTSDVVVMLPGWESSPGARAERVEADNYDIRVYELAEVLK